MPEDKLKKFKSRLNFYSLISFSILIGFVFWQFIRPKILITSCSEIALNTSHVQSRTSLFIDTTNSYKAELNKCLIDAGLDSPST